MADDKKLPKKTHVEKTGKAPAEQAAAGPERIDYRAFGRAVNNWMQTHNMATPTEFANHLANEGIDLGTKSDSARANIIDDVLAGRRTNKKIDAKMIETIANGCDLKIPYTTEPLMIKDPYGRLRPHGGSGPTQKG